MCFETWPPLQQEGVTFQTSFLAFMFINISDHPLLFLLFSLIWYSFLLQFPSFILGLGFLFQLQFEHKRVLDDKPVKQITVT
jgi:hypothetical protein